ncbi:hypothetical protein [Streptomyces sp. NBC_00102]|uniref:HflX-like GTP-binding protein n=1 Tax=Streptomyces sp. NBC_00102 TaxID=2975652 RepID=UPI0022577C61|nr:hypothetical protein [Streptomyces sp. NBC_00102]MCX5400675.1 hypothetical protein [Streptomyces sp. NBC_00102]
MHQPRRRDRRPARRAPREQVQDRAFRLPDAGGVDVVLVGYFSARQKDFEVLMASAAAELAARGARTTARIVQRRGVSDGGVRTMALPYSSRTLLSHGKVREVARVCEETDADAVVFLNSLTERQRRNLTAALGRPAVALADVL